MELHEINAAIEQLNRTAWDLENAYIENGGEVTEDTEALEAAGETLRELLTTEGVDTLGRWLKSKQDEIATAKAEKAAADARIKSLQKTEEYIKGRITEILQATGTEKVKGTFYSFAQTTSRKTSLLTEALDDAYLDLVTEAARNAGLPGCIDVALKTTSTRLQEAGAEFDAFVEVEETPSVKFTKPRAPKEI